MQDPIANMLTCVRNAQRAGIKNVVMAASQLKIAIVEVLKQEGFIADYKVNESGKNKKNLDVLLKYHKGKPVIETIKRISRPGLRVYKKADELPVVCGGLGVAIVSTPKGVMTSKEARKAGMGGEVLCEVA